MPKIKTKGAVKKRFKVASSGRIKRGQAYSSHLLTKKSGKRKRQLRKGGVVQPVDQKRIKTLLNI